MAFNKKTVKEIDLTNKRVLLRADYSVPVSNGKITDDYRIKQSLPTIKYILQQQGASLVIASHMGRPSSASDKTLSLTPVAQHLGELLGIEVKFVADCIGDVVKQAAAQLQTGQVLLLENVRFYSEEKSDDEAFAKSMVAATGAQVFVQDGFGVVHRKHATTDAIARLLPSVAGLLLEKEITTILGVMEKPQRPLLAVVGGAKISDKIDILNRLIDIADTVAIGGAMTNNFLLAQGVNVGKSLVEPELLDTTKEILEKAHKAELEREFSFLVPVDGVVAPARDDKGPTRIVDISSHSIADIQAYPKKPDLAASTISGNEMMLDVGPISAGVVAGAAKMARTIFWNGTMGVTEVKGLGGSHDPFAHATHMIVEAMIGPSNRHQSKPFTLVGGGDTVGYVESEGLVEDFSHVSTGGGATLDLIAGRKLPGVEVLQDKQSSSATPS